MSKAKKSGTIGRKTNAKDVIMANSMEKLSAFLNDSLTAYHARDGVKALLKEQGFTPLSAAQDWEMEQGGKYFIERGASILAFTIGSLDRFTYKIVAAHLDSPALKLKENPDKKVEGLVSLNVEKYGGGVWYSFLDRPLKIAGQIVVKDGETLRAKTATAPFLCHIPSEAIHVNRAVNEGFSVNPQVDLLPLYAFDGEQNFIQTAFAGDEIVAYDLYAVSAEKPYAFGKDDAFFAAPRLDNLTSVYAIVESLLAANAENGVCVAAFFHHEEIGSRTMQGAGGDFLEKTLKKIAFALRFDESEYDKALASSLFLSVDNAHAVHPNHPEKSDPTNRTKLGGGVVIKSHANGAYITDSLSHAIVKTVFEKAGVPYQYFFNRSDAKSGSTLGVAALTNLGVYGVDIGLPQLAMHSACECFAPCDYQALVDGLTAFYSCDYAIENDVVTVE